MIKILKDKYFLLCAAIAFIVIISSLSIEDNDSNGRIGIVRDVSESSSGYTFYFDQTDGEIIHCYSKTQPDERLCYLKGTWSDDGSMFFVSSLTILY